MQKNVAIDTMRKYQQIAQIYQKWNKVNDFSYNQAMSLIGEVLEDDEAAQAAGDQKEKPSKGEKPNGTDKEIHGVREELKAIEKELHNLNRILEKRKI